MLNRSLQLIAGVLMAGTLWAADNPFVGKWKVNPSLSKLNDEMKVEAAGTNRYAITFGPGATDTVVADGRDQPALSGSTLSITVKGPKSWEIIRKMKGRTLLTAHWTLSEDGKTTGWTLETSSGMGLSVTRERILGIYPDGKSSFSVRRCSGGGTEVEISLPLRFAGQRDSGPTP